MVEKIKNVRKIKRDVDASPLSCFPELMYNPKAHLSVLFTTKLDLKRQNHLSESRRYISVEEEIGRK